MAEGLLRRGAQCGVASHSCTGPTFCVKVDRERATLHAPDWAVLRVLLLLRSNVPLEKLCTWLACTVIAVVQLWMYLHENNATRNSYGHPYFLDNINMGLTPSYR